MYDSGEETNYRKGIVEAIHFKREPNKTRTVESCFMTTIAYPVVASQNF